MNSFNEITGLLQKEFLNNTYENNADFWFLIDHTSDQQIFKWADRLSLSNQLDSKDWLKLCSILHDYKQTKHWTLKERRYCMMMIIRCWDHLDGTYNI